MKNLLDSLSLSLSEFLVLALVLIFNLGIIFTPTNSRALDMPEMQLHLKMDSFPETDSTRKHPPLAIPPSDRPELVTGIFGNAFKYISPWPKPFTLINIESTQPPLFSSPSSPKTVTT